jgi:hypothetical protein
MAAPNTQTSLTRDVGTADYNPPSRAATATPAMPWKASLMLGAGTFVVEQ